MSSVQVNSLLNSAGNTVIDVAGMSTTGFYSRQIVTQVDTTNRTFTTSWALGPTFDLIPNCQARSLLQISYYVPARNDTTSWGGLYTEPQVRFNEGTWQSLGSSGYDGGVMRNGQASIGSYYQTLLIDPAQTSAFSVQFRFYFRSYDGTAGVNNGVNHDINVVSGTATIMSGNNGLQHYMHAVVEELARYN
jgi:hypothetical protein